MEQRLKDYITGIKKKLEILRIHNKKLIEFNYKLESFIVSLNTFSLEEFKEIKEVKEKRLSQTIDFKQMKQEIRSTKMSKMNCYDNNSKDTNKDKDSKDNSNKDNTKKTILTPINNNLNTPTPINTKKFISTPPVYSPNKMNNNDFSFISEQSQDDFKFNELINRITSNSQGKVNKMHIIKILGILKKSNGILLDDVIKKSGMSKYKCIDVLNILLKTEPPAIIKKFDKGFIYYINYD